MPQNPLNSWKPSESSEETNYIFGTVVEMLSVCEKRINEKLDKKDFVHIIHLATNTDSVTRSILDAVNLLSVKVEKLYTAVTVLAEKMDSEDVTNLDTNYAATVAAELN